MTRVLVTGAAGFVGRPLVKALAQRGYAVRATVRSASAFPPGIELAVTPDLAGATDYASLLAGIDIIVHLAALAHANADIPEQDYDRVNRAATAALAAAAKHSGVAQFIYLSSIRAQTGPDVTHVISETDQPRPADAYGRSKLAAEAAVLASGVAFTILRPVVVYGPHAKANVAALFKLAASPLPLPFGALTGQRSLLAIDNLVSAIVHVMETPAAIDETYLVADPTPVTLPQIITTLRRAENRRPNLLPLPPRLIEMALKAIGRGDLWQRIGNDLVASSAKLLASGWRPRTDTCDELAKLVTTVGRDETASGQ